MYIKKDYPRLKSVAYQAIKALFNKDTELRKSLEKIATTNYSRGGCPVPMIELAFLPGWESGWENGSKGCYRFHLILNFKYLKRRDKTNSLYLTVSHVPMTDNGHDWNVQEIDKHSAEPFKYRPDECNEFLKFLKHMQDEKYLRELFSNVITSDGDYKPEFVLDLDRRQKGKVGLEVTE